MHRKHFLKHIKEEQIHASCEFALYINCLPEQIYGERVSRLPDQISGVPDQFFRLPDQISGGPDQFSKLPDQFASLPNHFSGNDYYED